MAPFTAAPHHDVLLLLIQLPVLLLATRGLGEVARRWGQPPVVGEILAGIVLGPSMLSGLFPSIRALLVPPTATQGYLLETISLIGVMFLVLVTGLETDLALIRRQARTAVGVSAGGIVAPFASGFLLAWMLPDSLLAAPGQRLVFALFIATCMSISAIPVIAKVLIDMNLMRRDLGQAVIAAGMTDDAVGWALLSIVAGLAAGEAITLGTIGQAVGRVLLFIVLSFTLGRWLVKRAFEFVQDEVTSRDRLLTLVVALTVGWGAITQALHLEPVLGAFVMGILLGQIPRLPGDVRRTAESLALGVFAPIFFGVAGLKVNVTRLLEPRLIGVAVLVILVATAGKFVGAYAGARLVGRTGHWTALSFGAGLNARGAMEIIVATIGLSRGILSQDMFSIIVLMAMTTSLMAPPALRWILRRVQPEAEELKRLQQEELTGGSRVAAIHRVLVPLRVRASRAAGVHALQACLLRKMAAKTTLSVTLLTVPRPGLKADAVQFLDEVETVFPQGELLKKVVEGDTPADVILDEARKDYDLLVLGATEEKPGALFTSLADYLVRVSPCLTLVVKGGPVSEGWSPRRILVPTDGTLAAKHAAEIGFALAAEADEVTVLNVAVENHEGYGLQADDRLQRQLGHAHQIVQELRRHGELLDVNTRAEVRIGADAESVILEFARRNSTELIILGTSVRAGTSRLFLGARVERILDAASCPVVVVNAL